jgi:hypothetical protein
MEFLKKNKIILFIILPAVILVLIRALGTNHFRTDAKKLAEQSFSGSNIISSAMLSHLEGNKLYINIGTEINDFELQSIKILNISPDSILVKENLRKLRNHNGPVLLYSSDYGLSVRIWMLLSQMGIGDLFIFSEDTEPEILKHEFRPDTVERPELY